MSGLRMRVSYGTILVVLALLLALAMTNPSTDDYVDFLKNELKQTYGGNLLASGLADLLGGPLISAGTVRHNYVLFSVYVTGLEDASFTYLGVLGSFFPLESSGMRR